MADLSALQTPLQTAVNSENTARAAYTASLKPVSDAKAAYDAAVASMASAQATLAAAVAATESILQQMKVTMGGTAVV